MCMGVWMFTSQATANTPSLVLQNIGPVGNPGMPEAGYIPIPKKLAKQGIKDMVRISDGRMSGTASGAVILHVSPEAAVGGPLALVEDGDIIRLDVEARSLHWDVSDDVISTRSEGWKVAKAKAEAGTNGEGSGKRERGYRGLYRRTVGQADSGADFDFLRADYGQ